MIKTTILLSACVLFGETKFYNYDDGLKGLQVRGVGVPGQTSPEVISGMAGQNNVMRSYLKEPDSRCEVRTPYNWYLDLDKKWKMGFKLYFAPDGWLHYIRHQNAIFFQLHGTPDKSLGEVSRNPPINLAMYDDPDKGIQVKIEIRADDERVTNKPHKENYDRQDIYWLSLPQIRGKWTTWEIDYTPAIRGEGLFRVILDGQEIFKDTGPNAFNDENGPWPAWGLYKRNLPQLAEVYHDDVWFTDEEEQLWKEKALIVCNGVDDLETKLQLLQTIISELVEEHESLMKEYESLRQNSDALRKLLLGEEQ